MPTTNPDVIEAFAKIIDKANVKPQQNMSEVVLFKILDDLKSFVDDEKIDINEYFYYISRVGISKDLSKYLGRKKEVRVVL